METKRKEFDSAELKMIAMLTMLIDHIGAALIENSYLYSIEGFQMLDVVLRLIGRLAFPLYCFMLVEGFHHTRNRTKYAMRIFFLAIISELPFDLAFFGKWYTGYQNVLFTLFIGLVLIQILEIIEQKIEGKVLRLLCNAIAVVIGCMAASVFSTDYSYRGVLLIGILYLFRNQKETRALLGAALFLQDMTAVLAFIFILKYNGEKGKLIVPGWFYQIFYPFHIFVLWGIRCWLL